MESDRGVATNRVLTHAWSKIAPAALITTIAIITVPAYAQDVVVDWSSKKVVSSPSEVQKGNPLKVQVTQVNDVLYAYTVSVQVTTDNSDDFSLLASLLPIPSGPKGAVSGDPCVAKYDDAIGQTGKINTGVTGPAFNPDDGQGHYLSIPLSTTLNEWNGPISTAYKQLQVDVSVLSNCTDDNAKTFVSKTYPPIKNSIATIQKKVDGNHTANGQAPASAGDVVSATITVSEKWKDVETIKPPDPKADPFTETVKFTSVLRLSAGVLFSQLQDRAYVSRTVPSTSGSGTTNIVGVNGDSPLSPYLVGLLNYRLPIPELKNFDLWLATGPTLRITNSGSNASAFGYFGGVSVSLWNRFFVTPGIHFGQFAGVPAGLSVGQTLPPNFGQLQSINRWTARFGFSITYKTLSLGALTKSSSQKPAAPASNPTPNPTPKPAAN
jgi:hypothetical protein